jgi:hypothetical protein
VASARLGEQPRLLELGELESLKTQAALGTRLPFVQYQYVDVTFNAVADVNTEIQHKLTPATPEDIDFIVVRVNFAAAPAAAPVVYRDSSATRRPWGQGYIVLRANVAALSCTLLLTVRQTRNQ